MVYHGTPKGGFKEFKEESYFTPHRAYAERYVHAGGKGNIWGVSEGEPTMYELFLNIRKPFDTRTKADVSIFEREFLGKWGNNTPLSERGLPDWTDAADLLEFLEERGGGYDGVIIDEGGDPDANGNPVWRGVSYLTTSPTQIKSATENRGTFDGGNADITFSLLTVGELRDRALGTPLDASLMDNIRLALGRKKKANEMIRVSTCPWLLRLFGEKNVDVITMARNLSKMKNVHDVEAEDIYKALDGMRDPLFLIKDTPDSYIFIPGVLSKNRGGVKTDVQVPVQIERTADGEHFVVSAYPWDKIQKLETLVKAGKLIYSKMEKAELSTNGVPGAMTEDFKLLVVEFGFTDNTITLGEIVKRKVSEFSNGGDENGEPLVVYHGTPNHGFTVFDAKRQGERDHGDFGKGFYFTPSKEYAKTYTLPGYLNFGGDASKVYAVFINMRKPLYHNAYWGFPGYVDEEAHDGIIVGNDKYEELPYSHPKNFSEIVAVKPNRQGFYLHEVEVKEKLGNVFKTSTEGGTRQASRSILARWNDKVNTIFENCSKVVTRTGSRREKSAPQGSKPSGAGING